MRIFEALRRERPVWVWSIVAILAVVIGVATNLLGVGIAGLAVWVAAAGWFVLAAEGGRRLAASLIASVAVLSVAESVAGPGPLPTVSPMLVVALIAFAFTLERPAIGLRVFSRAHAIVFGSFIVLFLVSTLATFDAGRIAKALGISAMWLAIAVAAALAFSERAEVFARFARAVIAIGAAQMVIVVFEALGVPAVRSLLAANADGVYDARINTILGDWVVRVQGTFGYPIPLAAFLAVCVVLALTVSRVPLRFRIALTAVFLAGIVLTGSRSGVVAVGAGVSIIVIVGLWRARRSPAARRTLFVGLAICVGAIAAGAVFLIRAVISGDFSLFHRLSMFSSTWEFLAGSGVQTFLFGVGYGGVERAIAAGSLGSAETPVIDNAYLSAFLNSGLLGGIVLIALVVLTVLRSSSLTVRALAATLATSFFFFDAMQWHVIALFFCVAVGASRAPDASLAESAADLEPVRRG